MALKKKSINKLELTEKQAKPAKKAKKSPAKKAVKKGKKQPNQDLLKFGEKIKERRKELGYNNADFFAYDNSITRSMYSRWESGSDDLRLTSVLKLLRLMKIKPSEFFKDFD